MFVAVIGDELMVKLGAEGTAAALRREHVREMDFTGRPAKGAVFVQPSGLVGDELGAWVRDAVARARGLGPKTAREPSPGSRR